ncbi:hypothetical protein JW905_02980 [bacterium]|nr:hypothetical protein [candidate division CSSED10-310 bacterium]
MGFRSFALVFSLSLMAGGFTRADEPLPSWEVGRIFNGSLIFHASGDYAGGEFDLTFTADTFQLAVEGQGNQTLTHGGQGTYDCYLLSCAGTVTATGNVRIWEPITLDTQVELRNGTINGDYWVTASELAAARRLTVVSGEAWAYIFNNWQHIGSVQFTFAHEMDPPLRDFDFPVAVGDSWSMSHDNYLFGDLVLDVSIFGDPLVVNQHIEAEEHVAFQLNTDGVETVNSCQSYRTTAGSTGATELTSWYCPANKWYSATELTELVLSTTGYTDDLRLHAYRLDIDESTMPATPTPVPSPTPVIGPLGVALIMPATHFSAGDPFFLDARISNPDAPIYTVPLCVVLAYGEGYWFWPSWGFYPPEFDYAWQDVPTGIKTESIIDRIDWPDAGGPVTDIFFYGALLQKDFSDLMGEMGVIEWSYGP